MVIADLCENIAAGQADTENYPYVSWANVHNGVGGLDPGVSLSTINQVSANDWSSAEWVFFSVKWDEWIYVLHAFIFFAVFGTTPEMRRHYRNAFWYIPERFAFKRKVTEVETTSMSDVAFNSNPAVNPSPRCVMLHTLLTSRVRKN